MKMVLLVRLISELTHFNNEELWNVYIEVLANENIITFSEKKRLRCHQLQLCSLQM